jgi:hypothetical protein
MAILTYQILYYFYPLKTFPTLRFPPVFEETAVLTSYNTSHFQVFCATIQVLPASEQPYQSKLTFKRCCLI